MTKNTGIFGIGFLRRILAVFCCLVSVQLFGFKSTFENISEEDFKQLRADNWQVVGNNIILNGRVHLPLNNTEIFADKAIINMDSRDFEAIGNVRMYTWKDCTEAVDLQQIAELEKRPEILIREISTSQNLMGERTYSAKIAMQSDSITADRICGNINSGYFRFENMVLTYQTLVCRGESAEQLPNGETIITNGEISSCDYLRSSNAHYSISGSKIKLIPHPQKFYGLKHFDSDKGDRTVLMTNGFIKIHGLPLIWLPVFWKPKDEHLGLLNVTWGKESDWGFYLSLAKRFVLNEYPLVKLKLRGDFY
ncbi:MAG: LPS-assembly protein LptD [Lentisphaeria bacterium]|nr:LPS-assembly protein LptD [Lentisphaeria bacterium]